MGSSTGAAAAVLLCVALSAVVATASAAPVPYFISREVLEGTGPSSSRKLIGLLPAGFCPEAFDERRQMQHIASLCKGQERPKPKCCNAFRDLACPYAALLNDLNNGCNDILLLKLQALMRVNIGYFSLCGDSEEGLTCIP